MALNPAPGQKRGPEPDPKDERARQVEKELDDIMASDAFQGLIAETAKDARVMSESKANPEGLLKRKGIRIPEGVEVRFTDESAPREKRGPQPDPKDERARRTEKELDDIMASDAFQGLIAEAAKDARAMSELKANPKALLLRKGIRIPKDVDVRYTEESPWCICWYYPVLHCYCYWWCCYCYIHYHRYCWCC